MFLFPIASLKSSCRSSCSFKVAPDKLTNFLFPVSAARVQRSLKIQLLPLALAFHATPADFHVHTVDPPKTIGDQLMALLACNALILSMVPSCNFSSLLPVSLQNIPSDIPFLHHTGPIILGQFPWHPSPDHSPMWWCRPPFWCWGLLTLPQCLDVLSLLGFLLELPFPPLITIHSWWHVNLIEPSYPPVYMNPRR